MVKTLKEYENANNGDQQYAVSEFTNQHIYSLANEEVEYILQKSHEDNEAPFSFDDIVNYYPTCQIKINEEWVELSQDELDEKLEFYEYLRDKSYSLLIKFRDNIKYGECDAYTNKVDNFENNIYEKYNGICDKLKYLECDDWPEIMQWFAVSDFLYYKLEEAGECVLNGKYWGRQTCGQACALDNVIVGIYKSTLIEIEGF